MNIRFRSWKYPEIEEGKLTKWNWMVGHKEGLEIGIKVDIGAFVYIGAHYGIIIGDLVQIGAGTKIYSLDTIGCKSGSVILKKNCRIGANSVILPNTQIGENSIIGACSLLKYGTKIPPNEIWAGSPARKIGIVNNKLRKYG